MSPDEARAKLRADLVEWIEARFDVFGDLLDADEPLKLPVVSDFRLLLCLEDGADGDAALFYPTIGSDTALHRHIGLVRYTLEYLLDPER